MKFHLAVHRLVKDPALKQASGLLDWFKVGPWRSTAHFPEPSRTGSEPPPIKTYLNKKVAQTISELLFLFVNFIWIQ